MVIGSLSALVGFISEAIGTLITFLALPFLLYFEWIVLFFAGFHWSLHVESFPWWVSIGYYLTLFIFVYWLGKRRKANSRM